MDNELQLEMVNNRQLMWDPITGLYFYVDLNEIQQCIKSMNKILDGCKEACIQYELSKPFLKAYYDIFGKRKTIMEQFLDEI